MQSANMRLGLTRGWIVFSLIWWMSIVGYSAFLILREPPCYAFDTIALNDAYKGAEADFVKNLREKLLNNRRICAVSISSDLLSLERYAKDGAISQVSFAWQEPGDWSTKTHAMLQVLDNSEITSSRIVSDVKKFVYEARVSEMIPWALIMLSLPFAIFGIGAGIYWTATGFRHS